MGLQLTVSDILANVSQMSSKDLDKLVVQLNLLRAQKKVPALSKTESSLLLKINQGFSSEKLMRLRELDAKMEFDDMVTDEEAEECLMLAQELEAYTVQRFGLLKKLAYLRGISIEHLMQELGVKPK